MSRGIASEFQPLFGRVDELKRQGGRVGQVLELRSDQRRLYYLISKKSYQKPTYRTVWEALLDLREKLLTANVLKLAIPRLACGRDGLDWRIIRNMLEVLFRFKGIKILVCSWNQRGPQNTEPWIALTKLLAARRAFCVHSDTNVSGTKRP
ncbi:unnamed protein product [Callosobruchus maculatus]|uniref:Macro domain-containing protein n=1 Tax=Callosobruchus maculatus TaxID=64391 RepID=A0A653CR18_CALMS|nr:unnamed protein product [Callosobruchus maculatus]